MDPLRPSSSHISDRHNGTVLDPVWFELFVRINRQSNWPGFGFGYLWLLEHFRLDEVLLSFNPIPYRLGFHPTPAVCHAKETKFLSRVLEGLFLCVALNHTASLPTHCPPFKAFFALIFLRTDPSYQTSICRIHHHAKGSTPTTSDHLRGLKY